MEDPDDKILGANKELTLVHDKEEWEYFVKLEKCWEPPSYDIVDTSNQVLLQPKQPTPLLLTFLSFREAVA